MIKVTIDDVEIEVAQGTTILNAARQAGGDLVPPAMCYYSKLPGTGGKCRTCLVEVAAGSTADPRPCLLYTSPSPRDVEESRMPSSA